MELMLIFWVSGYAFFFGLTYHFYSVVSEKSPWWFYPLAVIVWPGLLGYQIGKIVSTFIEMGAIIIGDEDESI